MSTKTVRKQAAKKINEATSSNSGKTIGVITYWGLEGVRIKVSDLKALFAKHDLDEKWFPPEIRGSTAFRKALREAKADHKGHILRPIVEDDDRIVWGVVKEERDEANADLDLTCEAKVAYKKDTESVHCKGTQGSEALALAEKVEAVYQELTETFVSWDLQRMLRRNIGRDMGSITLRRGGGFYFTPASCLEDIEKHQRIVEEIGDSDMGVIIVTEDDRNKRTIGRDTRRSLEDDLNEVKVELDKFKAAPPRESTLAARLDQFKALKAKCDMYAEMLSIKVDDLKQGVDDAAQQIKALIGQVQAEAATKAGEKAAPAPKAEAKGKAKTKAPKAEATEAKGNGAPKASASAKADLKEKAKVRRVRKVQKEAQAG